MKEYDIEPVPGLPEPLPEGETLLWQGAPQWRSVALRVCHIRAAGIYFALLLAWSAVSAMSSNPAPDAASGALVLSVLGVVLLVMLCGLALLIARTTMYSVTTQRVVIRCGLALPLVLNIPFSRVASAWVKSHPDGTGDLVLTLASADHLAYLALWPHVRPWRFKHAEPMLRGLKDAGSAAQILARALAAASGTPAQALPDTVWQAEPVARPVATAAA